MIIFLTFFLFCWKSSFEMYKQKEQYKFVSHKMANYEQIKVYFKQNMFLNQNLLYLILLDFFSIWKYPICCTRFRFVYVVLVIFILSRNWFLLEYMTLFHTSWLSRGKLTDNVSNPNRRAASIISWLNLSVSFWGIFLPLNHWKNWDTLT